MFVKIFNHYYISCLVLLYVIILVLFCLEHASFVLSAANIYSCLYSSKWVMPSTEPKYLCFGCKKTARGIDMDHV